MTVTNEMIDSNVKAALNASDSFYSKSTSLYCFLDVKSGTYQRIFECDNDAIAIRIFYGVVGVCGQGNENIVSQYPEDFALIRLADFDVTKGIFNCLPIQLMYGSEARAYNIDKFSKDQKSSSLSINYENNEDKQDEDIDK